MAIIISADEIKKQIQGYNPNEAERFHRQSAKQADKMFEYELKHAKYKKAILMNGGTASGKTEFLSEYLRDIDAIVFDGTLPTEKGAEIKIKKILKTKKKPIIYSVLPDDLNRAFIAFLHRDRKFSDKHFYRTHSGSRKTLLWVGENYPEVEIKIFESSYSEKQDMIFREIILKNQEQKVEFLKEIQYNEDEIVKIIMNYDKENSTKKKSK
ncbi:MAG: hypothetical protein HQ539_00715 [Parcubacteria group bacterium]|nr:hypothetical protein [Parcubacteria group bacterium]